ncbi:tetratricopeptide repeat protein [Rhodopirellula sp. MGV]|uniref:tetratricopeptide repeat protein n=1 Tax=Rhodopirellula sp. MGV TaxID=2023130 RepID=UPI000B97480D|nr:tetratricopeptide repeat protein [Rhodopirellula sp. MGV]OYP37467.1 hypothetical protein CGZ80_04885 [Rhodopirellula sp. MGV]PNY37870.1 tetratricopeptide repeat protein [Rhodopirellula baltica]
MTEDLAKVPIDTAHADSNPTPTTETTRILSRRNIVAFLTLVIVTGIVYLPSLDGCFLLDDFPSIVSNNRIQTGVTDLSLWTSIRGLTMGSFAVNYQMTGLSPRGFHLVNHAIHLTSVALLFVFLLRLFRHTLLSNRSAGWAAFCTALIWGVHPLCTQAVSYLVQRAEILMAMAMLTFLIALDQSAVTKRKRLWHTITIFAFVAGMASKEVMVMAIPIGLIYDRCFLSDSWKQTLTRRGLVWGTCIGLICIAAVIRGPSVFETNRSVGFTMDSISPWQYIATQPLVILHYLRLVLWPDPLVFDYGWPPETQLGKIALGFAAMAGIIGIAIADLRRRPVRGFCVLAAILLFLPTSIIPLQDLAVEHRVYLSCGLLLAAILSSLFHWAENASDDNAKRLAIGMSCGVALVFSLLTLNRNAIYTSRVTMWQDVIEKTAGRGHKNLYLARAYTNLGEAHAEDENWAESIEALSQAVSLKAYPKQVHGNLARAYLELNQLDQAAEHIAKAVEANPKDARIRQQAGLLATRRGDYETAETMFASAHEQSPRDEVVLYNLGKAQLALNKLELAETNFRKAILLRPSEPAPYHSLIAILARQGKFQDAKAIASEFIQMHPDDGRVNVLLGSIHAAEGNLKDAVIYWQHATEQTPPTKQANFLLGNHFLQTGDTQRALVHFRAETEIDPKNIEALVNLGGLAAPDQPLEAKRYFQRALLLNPDYLRADFNVAAIDARLGNHDAAIERLRRIIGSSPDFLPAQQLLDALVSRAN